METAMLYYKTKKFTWQDALPMLIVFLASVIAIAAAMAYLADMPTVYKSAVTGKCLYVHDAKTKKRSSCDVLPERYDVVWVASFVHPVDTLAKH
jgi:hypothetical protein